VTYSYTYDAANQLTGVEIPGHGTITYSSYTWNRPDEVILPGGSRRQYIYDPLMRVKSITAKDPGQNVVMSYQYSYDKMDNIIEKATEHGPYDYGYDDLYRLTDVDNPVQTDEAYSYDSVGNRLTSAEHTDWNYNINNELQHYDGVTFRYDANGNTIEKNDNGKITKYFYNIEDRLVRVEDTSGTVIATYYYDPFGRRLWKEVDEVLTYFVYSDEGLVGEYSNAGTAIKSYGYKIGSNWTTDPLFVKEAGLYYFYQNDHLGTPQKMTGINGALMWSCRYSSFGKAEIEAGSSVKNNLRFGGQYYDQETMLHYNWQRYYDLKTGRYLTTDPIELAGGINLFVYSENNPINAVDPFGLLVQVGQHPAFINHPSNPYSHTAIVLRPSNPADFKNHPFFQNTNGTMAILSGHARFEGTTLFLISTPNYPGDDPCNLTDLTTVASPQYMTDTDFINALIAADRSYNNNTPYNVWPYLGNYEYNSNSFVSGIIKAAGGVPPVLSGSQPGYSQPLPLVLPHRKDNLH
jgi:RHS repeat-associated protein